MLGARRYAAGISGLCLVMGMMMVFPARAAPNESGTSAKAAVVIDSATGRALFAYNADECRAQASTTKIMTTLLALEEADIDTFFTVDTAAIHVEGSSMGLVDGDQVSLRQLCYGMILPSGNDAANAVAVHLAGDIPAFAKLMNERAFQLGLADTAFVTPSGLDAYGHYTTARDLAVLSRYAMADETFREIACQYTAQTHFGNPPYDRRLKNHNKLLDFYEPCIGVKTGFTDGAGRVLVSAAQKGGVELICVTMDDPDDWADHQNLYERFFAELTPTDVTPLIGQVEMDVAGGVGPALAEPVADVRIPLRAGELERLEIRFTLDPFAYAPVAAGDYMGMALLALDGQVIHTVALHCAQSVGEAHPYKERFRLARWIKGWLPG